ncbi:YafY family protein [Paenibacillus sp. ISL-20]|uniref:helix-turn-helix transcriptional regulator n=1 Tax=Paenibacillus sp. ISL-20 TaxID=2819163 RepID=UPI001BE94A3E|nr:YafY family protein [Paenibacillus sp. ISL-20]MBT2765211.1 YafY family transcriptional regulator [Paenibacillus sp. ISL-20]
MSKAKQLMDVIMYVNAKRSFTAQEVADEFDVSVRTAHRYLTEISDMGVPLYTEQGRHGGYRTLKSRVLPPILFDEDEVFAIFFAFQALKRYTSLPFELNIDSASRKLLAGFPEDTKMMISRLESVLTFWSPNRTAGSPYLKDVIEAALHQQVIRISYRSKSGTSDREVLPIGVYAQDGLWYMPAVEHEKEGVRVFRMDRMESLALTDNTYEVDFSMQEWLEDYPIREPVRLYVELTREGARQCESIAWLENEVVMQDEHQGIVDTIVDRNDFEYVAQVFLRLGMEAKVIEPPEIVDMLREKARQLSLHYGVADT